MERGSLLMKDSLREEFWELCSLANREYENTYSPNDIEHLLLEILVLVRTNSLYIDTWEECFQDLVNDGLKGPYEILIFCMRELRWDTVKNMLENRIQNTNDHRIISVMNQVLEVYNDEWNDSDLYHYYSK